jgi:hypothetical protein
VTRHLDDAYGMHVAWPGFNGWKTIYCSNVAKYRKASVVSKGFFDDLCFPSNRRAKRLDSE